MKSKNVPFDFVLDELYSLDPVVKPMFGCHAIYIQNKIVLMLRLKEQHAYDNGVWVASLPEHWDALKREFPSLRTIKLFGETVSSWQNLPHDADDFEESVLKICALVRKNDARIGKIPKPKKRKKKD